MTFLEAAIEILRTAEGPLHFSEVAKRAVEANLLSHVGRDPEAAMRTCLNSASRLGRDGQPPIILREGSGLYEIRPGADLPAPIPRPASKADDAAGAEGPDSAEGQDGDATADDAPRSRRRGRGRAATARSSTDSKRKSAKSGEELAEDADVDSSSEDGGDEPSPSAAAPASSRAAVEFVAPAGSGLDGVTDVALVMANAMSRLVEERPELREELDAMQAQQPTVETVRPGGREPGRFGPRPSRAQELNRDRSSSMGDERGRRRRRRRRRGKRVEWTGEGGARPAQAEDTLLDEISTILEGAGPRSLHVRQIAEQLGAKGLLGGEISELERAATAALLVDIRAQGRKSRFCARGEGRYQAQAARIPERAAKAEGALREAVRQLETETQVQFAQWLQSLGIRGLESLVRIWLQREGYPLVSTLPPHRGVSRLIVEDPEGEDEDARLLAVIVSRRTPLEARLWEGDLERHQCTGLLVFSMAEGEELGPEVRMLSAQDLAQWLREQGIGVQRVNLEVSVLDPVVIESVAGLDS